MSFTPVPLTTGGYAWSAANHNQYIRDNFAAGVPDIFTAKGQLPIGSGTNAAVTLDLGSDGFLLTVDTGASKGLEYKGVVGARQGNSSTDWTGAGTTNYTPGRVSIMLGTAAWTGSLANNGTYSFSLPASFANKPIMIVTPQSVTAVGDIIMTATVTSVNSVQVKWRSITATTYTNIPFSWICIGEAL